jgi:hypothetical protein
VNASANGWLSMDGNGQIQVSFTDVSANASGAGIDVSADDWYYDWIIDLFEGELADELERFVEDELYDYVAYDLGPDLAEELNSLDLSYSVDVGGKPYGVSFGYDTLSVPEAGVALGFKMGLTYDRDSRVPANPGAMAMSTAYQLDTAPTAGFLFGEDFFNAALHALWEGGSMYLDETLWEDPVVTGSSNPLLPPVIVPGASPYLMELELGDLIANLNVYPSGSTTPYAVKAALSTRVDMNLTPIVDGQNIRFDVTFGPATVNYDLLGAVPIPVDLQAASEEAMSVMVDQLLLELEGYLEDLEISYLDIPMTITGLSVGPDPTNPAMTALDLNAVYSGP